jgi:hypothetical protein
MSARIHASWPDSSAMYCASAGRSQPAAGSSSRLPRPRREGPGVGGEGPANPLVEPVDEGERRVGLGPGAEEDLLEHLARVGEALERTHPAGGVLQRPGERDRVEGADHQRPLTVEEADGALAVDSSQDRLAAREVALVARRPSWRF